MSINVSHVAFANFVTFPGGRSAKIIKDSWPHDHVKPTHSLVLQQLQLRGLLLKSGHEKSLDSESTGWILAC